MASDESLPFASLSPPRKRQRSSSQNPSSGSDNAKASRRKRRRHDLSVEVCKEFIRGACRRAEIVCKFAHPLSNVTIERGKVTACADSLRNRCFRGRSCRFFHPPHHIRESIRKAIDMEDSKDLMRQRSPSQSPSCDNGDAEARRSQRRRHDVSVEVCKDFIRSGCRRAEIECKFAHPPSGVTIERGKVEACIDSLRGMCFRGRTCPYYHPPAQIQESLLKEIDREDIKDPMDLEYPESSVKLPSHPQPGNDQEFIPVCRDFLKNACNRHSCKYAHPDSHAMGHLQHHGLSPKVQSSTLLENGAIPNARMLYHDIVPVCKDFLKNACKRDNCKYFHLIPQSEVYLQQHEKLVKLHSSPAESEQKRVSVCRDFLKNACERSSCKYAHPNSRTKVVDNQVEICHDFLRGHCHRSTCCFYHPPAHSAEK